MCDNASEGHTIFFNMSHFWHISRPALVGDLVEGTLAHDTQQRIFLRPLSNISWGAALVKYNELVSFPLTLRF